MNPAAGGSSYKKRIGCFWYSLFNYSLFIWFSKQ
jgi:hypothetical protein